MAWTAVSPGSNVGRHGSELRAVLGVRDGRGALSLRRAPGRDRVGEDSDPRANEPDLALLSARCATGAVVWLSGARPVCARTGPPLQSGEAAPGSVREVDQRTDQVE